MSDKRTSEYGRRLRYRRRLRGEAKAVSPVVATLILILIAVAAAAALYLWLVAWQGGVTKGIGSPGAQYTVTIGGSTSVYPFAEAAAAQFESNNSDVVISVNQGGSGAGMAAVCAGQVDIGEASTFYGTGLASTPSTLETSYGCPTTVYVEVIAYDGVDAITPSANVHGLNSISWDTLQSVFVASSPATSTLTSNVFQFGAEQINGKTAAVVQPVAGTPYAWDQIPACAPAQTNCAATGSAEALVTGGVGGTFSATYVAADYGPCNVAATGGSASNLCSYGVAAGTLGTASATPCGFNICAGGNGAGTGTGNYGATIYIVGRSDVSGTTQSFIARDMAVGASGSTPLGIGFTGCSGDNQFDGCGITLPHTASGNPAVISAVSGNPDALGYASDGLAQAGGSGVIPVNLQGYGQSVVVAIQGESTALKAIAAGIGDHENNNPTAYETTQAYVGWRPFLNVETAPPTGEVLRYLQWVMDPANNQNIASETAEISVYASGLAGVVPVTPLPPS